MCCYCYVYIELFCLCVLFYLCVGLLCVIVKFVCVYVHALILSIWQYVVTLCICCYFYILCNQSTFFFKSTLIITGMIFFSFLTDFSYLPLKIVFDLFFFQKYINYYRDGFFSFLTDFSYFPRKIVFGKLLDTVRSGQIWPF